MNVERSRVTVALLAVLLVLAAVPGLAAAETRSGGTVVVAAGETVNEDLTAFGGNVVVRGTVNGDLTAFAGNVVVTGTVTGDVEAVGGNVRVEGDVGGDLTGAAGTLLIGPEATIDGNVEFGAGTATVRGEIAGDAAIGADELTVGPSAVIGGNLEHDAETFDRSPDAEIGGSVTRNEDLGGGEFVPGPVLPNWIGAAYGFLVNLLFGALLLLVLPGFSGGVARRAIDRPLYMGGYGLLVLIAVPILLVLFAITIIGIPITILGALVFALVVWIAYLYGAFAVGAWLVSLADSRNPWLALVVGLLVVALVGLVPFLGGLVQFLVSLLGLGALAAALRAAWRGRRGASPRFPATADGSEPAGDATR